MATLAQGSSPSAVTDAAGTLHVVWRQFNVPGNLLYCRVPAGGAACAPVQIAEHVGGTPYLLLRPQDGALIAVVPTLDDALGEVTTVVASGDGGTTWSGQAPVGVGMDSISDAKLTPDGGFVDTVRSTRQPGPLPARRGGRPASSGGSCRWAPTSGSRLPHVTHLADGRPVVVAEYADDRLGTRVAVLSADADVPGSWTAPGAWRSLAGADASAADAGPTGTWLLATNRHRTSTGTLPVRIWRWGTARVRAPADDRGARVHRGPGRRRRAGHQQARARRRPGRAAARRLAAGHAGLRRTAVHRLPAHRSPRVRPADRLSAGPGAGRRHEALLESPPTAAAAAGWCGTTSPIASAPCPLVTPPLGSRVGSRRIGTLRVTIPDFYGCVPSGGRFVHRLRLDGRRGTTIASVRFFFDAGQPARIDHRAPWRTTFRLTFAPGTRHVAAAIVRYRLPGRAHAAQRANRTHVRDVLRASASGPRGA